MIDGLSIAIGIALIAIVLVDVFQTLFNPSRIGSYSERVLNRIWRGLVAKQRVRPVVRVHVGPVFILSVVLVWLTMVVVGGALIYRVYIPGGEILLISGLLPEDQDGFVDALYFSAVVLATLGFGDITPRSDFLRLFVPFQAGVGFVLLTSGITWVLGIYPVLIRRQQFTQLVHALQRQLGPAGFAHPSVDAGEIPTLARDVAQQLMTVRADLLQFPITFYFHRHEAESNLPDVLLYVPVLIESIPASEDAYSNGVNRGMLELALHDFEQTLEKRFPVDRGTLGTLATYAALAGFTRVPDEVPVHALNDR